MVIQGSFRGIQRSSKGVQREFQGSFKDMLRKFQGCQICVKNFSIKFCFQFCTCMDLIAATRAEGVHVILGQGQRKMNYFCRIFREGVSPPYPTFTENNFFSASFSTKKLA